MTAYLHQLLAVEPELDRNATEESKRLLRRFDAPALYNGMVRTYRPLTEDEDKLPPEFKNMEENLQADLQEFGDAMAKFIDVGFQKESTNASASALLTYNENLDGLDKEVFRLFPATALLNLENKLTTMKKVLQRMPVYDPTKKWEWHEGNEVYEAPPEISLRTKKQPRSRIAAPATAEHPAQIQAWTEDRPVGEWTAVYHTCALPPAKKRQILERITNLILAVKRARQEANMEEAVTDQIGDKIVKFILGQRCCCGKSYRRKIATRKTQLIAPTALVYAVQYLNCTCAKAPGLNPGPGSKCF